MTVKEELIIREKKIQSLREHTETVTQPTSSTTQTPPEMNTQRADTHKPKHPRDQEKTSRKAEIVILIDANGKYIDEKQLFPRHTILKRSCPYTASALLQLDKEELGNPGHIIIHVGTNDLKAQQESVAQSISHVAIKVTKTFPSSKTIISNLLPRTDFPPQIIQRVNTEISRRCAERPNIRIVHHPTLGFHPLQDHVHLHRDNVHVFA